MTARLPDTSSLGLPLGANFTPGMIAPISCTSVHEAPSSKTLTDVVKDGSVSVDRTRMIAFCSIGSGGGICMISETESVSSTVSVDISATYDEWLKAGLSYSWAHSKTLGIQCNSLPMNPGDVWAAFPAGYKYKFRVSSEFSVQSWENATARPSKSVEKASTANRSETERADTAVIVPGCPM